MAIRLFPSGKPEDYDLSKFEALIRNVIEAALIIAGGLAIIFLIWGAIQYFTAYGNEEKAQRAKNTLIWAIIGIVIVLLSYIIIGEVWQLIRGEALPTTTPPAIPSPPTP